VNAKLELVVASAGKPSTSSMRAEPASHGFGITNGYYASAGQRPVTCKGGGLLIVWPSFDRGLLGMAEVRIRVCRVVIWTD
jgi:hypothetical protein